MLSVERQYAGAVTHRAPVDDEGVIVQMSNDEQLVLVNGDDQRPDLTALDVVVVDDSYHMRRLLRTLLQVLKIRSIHEAENGADALQALRTSPCDVLLADCQMQPVDGIQLAQRIRRSRDLPDPALPIIMISGHSSPELITQARDVGVHGFLVKPVSVTALRDRIVAVLKQPRSFVRTDAYVGPCRRRRDRSNYSGPERRGARRGETDD